MHYGSHSFGHYVAFRRRPDLGADSGLTTSSDEERASPSASLPDWYRISDETVDPSNIHEALRANPFLLFYERVRNDDRLAGEAADPDAGPRAHGALAGGAMARVVESWRAAQRRDAAKRSAAEGGST